MISSTEMVMNPSGEMVPLEKFINNGSTILPISSVKDLPNPCSDTLNTLFILNDYRPEESAFGTIFDAKGDISKMLDGAVNEIIPIAVNWNDFYALKITGAYKPTGEIWNEGYAEIMNRYSLLGINFNIKDNSNNIQGKYVVDANGLLVVADTWGNCVIDKIEGKRKTNYPTLITTIIDNDLYKWVDLINKKEVTI